MGSVEFRKSKLDLQNIIDEAIKRKQNTKSSIEKEIEDLKQEAFVYRVLEFNSAHFGLAPNYKKEIITILDTLSEKGKLVNDLSLEIESLRVMQEKYPDELFETMDSFSDDLQHRLVSQI